MKINDGAYWYITGNTLRPKMFVGGANCMNVKQGVLDNHWLLVAMASLCSSQRMLSQVIPPNQGWGAGLVAQVLLTFN